MSALLDKNIYFASDFHLGAPNPAESLVREKAICAWMDYIRPTCGELFLVGDIFDFWFEYRHAIPKGFVRLQGKIAEFTDAGIPVHVFTGNHDMWIFDYIPQELGVQLYREPILRTFGNKKFYIGHGDGLGPGDKGYKFLKKVFASKVCQWLFARIHPNLGIGLANYSSKTSRAATGIEDEKPLGEENEWLAIYSKEQVLLHPELDYFIFGHRHLPLSIPIAPNAEYMNLGDWLQYNTYAVFDGDQLTLKTWNNGSPADYFPAKTTNPG
jgi:UDP-2,3-diacylglucosamine hydrolase